jgi:UDPglucose--hexose-1-phosphate uridylyltransferase
MPEFRRDELTGQGVIIAPERGRRPGDWRHERRSPLPAYSADCPFCPGNEEKLPGIEREWPAGSGPHDWTVRAVPNRYPAVGPAERDGASADADDDAAGLHEVLIEGPRHDLGLADRSPPELLLILRAYQERLARLRRRPRIQSTILFRNHGQKAGASLAHPHAQLVALTRVPTRLAALVERSRQAYERKGACPTCLQMEAERKSGLRLVAEDEASLTVVPFAAQVPFEQSIFPKNHVASFADIPAGELGALARALREALLRLRRVLDDAPYNILFDDGPVNAGPAPFLHWHVRIVPRLTVFGGFEQLSGEVINPSLPEEDAKVLRSPATSARSTSPARPRDRSSPRTN